MELGNPFKGVPLILCFLQNRCPSRKSTHSEKDGMRSLGVIVFQRYNSKLTVDQKIRILQRNAQRV